MPENAETRSCAVGPCDAPRDGDGMYCVRHGPRRPASSRTKAALGDAQIVCPHCSHRGSVRTSRVKVKRGVSGGKATAAVLTVGISVLATGLSRKQRATSATCGNCNVTWTID